MKKKYSVNLKVSIKEEKKEQMRERQSTNEMVDLNWNILVIVLNVNGLNSPVKRKKLSEWF